MGSVSGSTALLVGTSTGTALRAVDGQLLGGVAEGVSLPATFSAKADLFVQWDSKSCMVRTP